MLFDEVRISKINYLDPEAVYQLIVSDLCGEQYHRKFNDADRAHLTEFLTLASQEGLTYERFNELLLLLEQDRVSEPFYNFFFSPTGAFKLADIAKCVIKFRGYAMLQYGDFRFAYKQLSTKTRSELSRSLQPFCEPTSVKEAWYRSRPSGALQIERIERDKAWCLGYLTRIRHDKESDHLAEMLSEAPKDAEKLALAEFYRELGATIAATRAKGLRNTDVYLTWDYMDVYVATSMRRQWEFEDVADLC